VSFFFFDDDLSSIFLSVETLGEFIVASLPAASVKHHAVHKQAQASTPVYGCDEINFFLMRLCKYT
jgi:hypothetical protein